ncbi:MAG: Wzz/FepE/Etk N-terminal domain-containing protein [Congregibacter sp.]
MNRPTPRTDQPADAPSPEDSAYRQKLQQADSEIDVFELAAGLWSRRALIAKIISAFLLIAAFYAWVLASEVYTSTSSSRATSEAALVALNETGAVRITPESALARVIYEAQSRETQRAVFDSHLPQFNTGKTLSDRNLNETFVELFTPKLQILVSGAEDTNTVTTLQSRFQHSDPDYAASIANAILEQSHNRARAVLIGDLRAALEGQLTTLENTLAQQVTVARQRDLDEISRLTEADTGKRLRLMDRLTVLRAKDQRLREDRIKQLEEALAIAGSLNLTEPRNTGLLAQSSSVTPDESANSSISLTVIVDQEYLKGTRQLAAELAAISNRESNDPFDPEIRDLEAELALLERNPKIEVLQAREDYLAYIEGVDETRMAIVSLQAKLAKNYETAQLMQMDQLAIAPSSPVKPRRLLILVSALVAGIVISLIVALTLNAASYRIRAQS